MAWCQPTTVPNKIYVLDSTATVNNLTEVIDVTVATQSVQVYPLKFAAINIPSLTLSPTVNYTLNVNVSFLNIQHGVVDIQLLPVSNIPQTTISYTFISGNYLDTSNNILQVYVYISTNSSPVNYTQPSILYVTYY
jgi:hypothetical protein